MRGLWLLLIWRGPQPLQIYQIFLEPAESQARNSPARPYLYRNEKLHRILFVNIYRVNRSTFYLIFKKRDEVIFFERIVKLDFITSKI